MQDGCKKIGSKKRCCEPDGNDAEFHFINLVTQFVDKFDGMLSFQRCCGYLCADGASRCITNLKLLRPGYIYFGKQYKANLQNGLWHMVSFGDALK